MNHVLLFKKDDGEHPLEIIDRNSDRWVSRSQLGYALGVGNLRPLHSRLAERGELRQGLHWRNESLPRPDKNGVTRHREMVIYSYRGVIPVAMHSEGPRAMTFRDWAETVLYDVMTTGGYTSGYTQTDTLNSLRRMAEDDTALEKMFRKRKTGLMEIGFDRSVATRKAIESIRRDTGIDLSNDGGSTPPNLRKVSHREGYTKIQLRNRESYTKPIIPPNPRFPKVTEGGT